MGNVLRELKIEFSRMPEYHLKDVAIKSYGMSKREISRMGKEALIENMLAIEFRNSFK